MGELDELDRGQVLNMTGIILGVLRPRLYEMRKLAERIFRITRISHKHVLVLALEPR